MGTHAWKKKGIRARREGALERLKASKFTPKIVQGKERNEKNKSSANRRKGKKLSDKEKFMIGHQVRYDNSNSDLGTTNLIKNLVRGHGQELHL